MDKQKLLEYLKAVCDGESAKYACEEVIQTLNTQMGNLKYESAPEKSSSVYVPPREPVGDPSGPATGWGCGTAIVAFISMLTWLNPNPDGFNPNIAATFIVPIIAGIVAVICVFLYFKQMERDRRELQRYEEAKAEERAQANYNTQVQEYRKRCDIVDVKRNTLKHIIAGYEAVKADIEKQLTALYDRGIIHEKFRDIVAVHQIREYLEVGVCDVLDGINGAYAMYYNDIRTKKIIESITDLKRSMARAFNNLASSIAMSQGQLIREIQMTNANLQSLSGTIDNSLRGINSRMDGLSHTLDMQSRELSESNEHARKIEHAITASAYNDYITKRLDYIGNYDRLHRLKDPLS